MKDDAEQRMNERHVKDLMTVLAWCRRMVETGTVVTVEEVWDELGGDFARCYATSINEAVDWTALSLTRFRKTMEQVTQLQYDRDHGTEACMWCGESFHTVAEREAHEEACG